MTTKNTTTNKRASAGTTAGRWLDRGVAKLDGAWASVGDAVLASSVGRWFKRVERPNALDWALLIAISAVALVTFLYADAKTTFEHSFNFLDSVLAGRPQDFYQIAIENSTFGHPAVYDVPIYAIFALWNLPTYVLHHLTGFDYLNSLPAELWLKLMIVIFALAAARLMVAIAKTLGMTAARAKWVAFYFLSSMGLFIPVFVIVQYDIISITLMLAGLLAYLRGNTRSFLLWFLAANTLKLFGLFIFIPLVLLREKRLPRAFVQILIGVAGLLLCRLLYRGNLAYVVSTAGFNETMLARLRTAGFDWQANLSAPLFVIFLVGLVIFAYAKRTSSQRELQAFALYIAFAGFLVFCALVPLNTYWIALVAPFAVLIIFANPRHLTLNSLLEVSIGASLFVIYALVGYSIYNSYLFTDLLFGRLVPGADPQRFASPAEIFKALGVDDNITAFLVGFMIACVIAVLVINYPRASFVAGMPNIEPIKRTVVWVRLAAPAAFCALLFAVYLIPPPPTAYSSATDSPTLTDVNILAPGSAVEETLTFADTLDVEKLRVGLDATQVTWIDSAIVTVGIVDPTGATVFEGEIGANEVGAGPANFSTPGLVLEKDTAYTVRIGGRDGETEPIRVRLNPAQDEFVTTADGQVIPGDIILTLVGSAR
ncbi:hypothetical protein ASF06_06055 [Agreia sp. Leaf244]|uniref:hypothetical protein n=1 Tax=Agreia sp. Leaf244 TaxID=1736305 RepID=UPI0006FABE37|nr:hypothetical protein [Agreia sp. Leaf244]KQO09817.1 hypothetical protein ASF06_06055 [Agreia sp. Leaf244]